MRYKSTITTSLPGLLLPPFLFLLMAGAQAAGNTTKSVNAHGDEGYWQSGQPDIMILWPQDDENVVKRFSGGKAHPYPYRLWVDPKRSGGFPVLLKDEESFNNFLEHIKQNDDKDWCQLAASWSAWSGQAPTACGVHSYTEQRTCSIAPDAQKPCADLCKPAVKTRTRQVDNGPCQPSTPPPTGCSISAWTPARSSVCSGTSFTQSRTRADCSTEQRSNTGTKSCPQTCTATSWAPSSSTVCSGNSFTQTRTLSELQYCQSYCQWNQVLPADLYGHLVGAVQQYRMHRQQPDTDPHIVRLQHRQPHRQRNQVLPAKLHGHLMGAIPQHGLFRHHPDTDPHPVRLQHRQPHRQRNQVLPAKLHGYLVGAIQQYGLFRHKLHANPHPG